MYQVDILADDETVRLDDGTHELVDRTRADSRLDDHRRTLGANLHHFLHGCHHVAGVHLLRELVVGSGDRHDVHVRLLVLGGELDAGLQGILKQFVEAVLLKGRMTRIERGHQLLVIVRSDHFHPVRGHHKGCRQSDVAQSNYIYHN